MHRLYGVAFVTVRHFRTPWVPFIHTWTVVAESMIFAHFISIEVISNVQDVPTSFVFCSTLLQANVLKVFAIPRFWRPFCPVIVNKNSESVSSPYLQPKLYPNFPSLGWKDCWRIWRVSVTLAFCLSSSNTNAWCESLLGLNAFNGITRIINVVSFPKTTLYRMELGIWFRCIEISTIETGLDQAITIKDVINTSERTPSTTNTKKLP